MLCAGTGRRRGPGGLMAGRRDSGAAVEVHA